MKLQKVFQKYPKADKYPAFVDLSTQGNSSKNSTIFLLGFFLISLDKTLFRNLKALDQELSQK